METIRRKIKVFWLEHSDPIIFFGGIIIGIILITQFLNMLTIEKNKEEAKNNIINEGVATQTYTYNTEDKNLIQNFITFCKENEAEKAYELLSYNCKNELYQTYETFVSEYYNKLFNKKVTPEISYYKEKQLYKITYYFNVLENGGYKEKTVDYYKIEQDVIENKIYINFYKDIK